jgi:hypothetical protein
MIKASAARQVRLVLGVFPVNPPGILTLDQNLLKWEPNSLAFLAKPVDIPLSEITATRNVAWPNRLLLAVTLFPWWLLFPPIRRSFAADLEIRTSSAAYHFAVKDIAESIDTLEQRHQ